MEEENKIFDENSLSSADIDKKEDDNFSKRGVVYKFIRKNKWLLLFVLFLLLLVNPVSLSVIFLTVAGINVDISNWLLFHKSKDYFAPGVEVVSSLPEGVFEETVIQRPFSPDSFPVLKEYGYNSTHEEYFATIEPKAQSNSDESLFALRTSPRFFKTFYKGEKIIDPVSGYDVESLLVFNEELSSLKRMPFPQKGTAFKGWLGKDYVVGLGYKPKEFYIGDVSTTSLSIFTPISNSKELLAGSTSDINVYRHPSRNVAAVVSCNERTHAQWSAPYCAQYAIHVLTPQRMETVIELVNKKRSSSINIKWDEKKMYVEHFNHVLNYSNAIYSVNLEQYSSDTFIPIFDSAHLIGTREPDAREVIVTLEEGSNTLAFLISFNASSSDSRGFLTVKLDGEVIGTRYEEQSEVGVHKMNIPFKEREPGEYVVEIAAESLNPAVHAEIGIGDITVGRIDYESRL